MVDNITLTCLKDHIQFGLQKYCSHSNISLLDCKVESEKFKNNSFISDLYKILLKCKVDDNEYEKHIFLKDVKCSENPIEESHPISYFKSEIFMYETVFPVFDRLQNFLMAKMKFNHVKYLFGSTEIFKEYLVFDDLSLSGYATESRDRFLDINHMHAALTQLAKFHGCSLVYRNNCNENYLRLTKNLKERLITPQEWFESILKRSYEKSRKIVQSQFKTENFCSDILPTVYQLAKSEEAENYAVIGHGDLWTGNILFKHDQVGNIEDCVLVDWQLVRHHSPVIDILHLIFTSSAEEIRCKDLFSGLINYYHMALRQYLKCHNLDIDTLLPMSVIWKHLKKFAPLGMAIGLVALPLHARSFDGVINVEEMLSGQRDLLEFNFVSAYNFQNMISYMFDILSLL